MDLRGLLNRTTIEEVEPSSARAQHLAGARLIDVREPDEYSSGHAPGAELLPLGQLQALLPTLPKGQEILFICRSGRRSGIATEMAGRAGLRARNVRGGMIAWSQAGLPIEK